MHSPMSRALLGMGRDVTTSGRCFVMPNVRHQGREQASEAPLLTVPCMARLAPIRPPTMQDPGRRMPRALVLEIAVQIGVEQLESCQLLGLEAKRHGILVALGPRGGEPNSTYGPFTEFMIGRHDVPSVCVLRSRGCAGCIIERLSCQFVYRYRYIHRDNHGYECQTLILRLRGPIGSPPAHRACR